MATIHEGFEIDRPIAEVFDAVADFTTNATWDPGVRRSVQVVGNVVGLGTEFDVDLDITGLVVAPTFRYRITTYNRPDHVVLETEGLLARGRDDVTFTETATGGTRVDWTADFSLRGLGRLMDPILALGFRRVGQRAVAGLEEWLRAGGTGGSAATP